jgi:uncharacterized repeat protein (TIGR03803 family)
VQGRDGDFYGTTQGGVGVGSGYGTVFKIGTNGVLTTLYSFTGGNDGGKPAWLVQGTDGNFYGTTSLGGHGEVGTVFRISLGPVITMQGSLQVMIAPVGAVSAGAQWQVDAGADQQSGVTVSGLAVGSHIVSFTPISGWTTPANQTVMVKNDTITKVSGIYEALPPASALLILQTNGNGKVTPNDTGKLLGLGTNFSISAVPGHNWIFSNWVGGTILPYSVLSDSLSYTFTMQSNLVVEANFVSNPFIPAQGIFNGLFLDTNNVTEASSGFFTLTLATTGAFTGKIMTSGSTYSLPTKAKFDVGGQVEFTMPTKTNTLTFDLKLDISDPANQQITGTVSDGTWTAGLTADRAVFSATANKAVNFQGHYTLAIAGSDDGATSPGGFSCATLSINSAGLITMAGNLADGTAMSQTVSVSKDGRWPFYASYATPPAGNGGAAFGWINFSNLPASALGGTMYWFRPAGKTPAVYQRGFTNTASIVGSAYKPTDKPLLALTIGQVTLDGGNLPFTITNQITLSPADTITVPHTAENTNKLLLTITKTIGVISGSFANPSNPKKTITVNGVLLQNQTNVVGHFLGTNESGVFLIEKP